MAGVFVAIFWFIKLIGNFFRHRAHVGHKRFGNVYFIIEVLITYIFNLITNKSLFPF